MTRGVCSATRRLPDYSKTAPSEKGSIKTPMVDSDVKVIVIDDDASMRRSMARLLQSAGYGVETLPSAEDYLKKEPGRGCLVLDLDMPGLNGLELQAALARAHRWTPIVFVSGHGKVPDSVQAMKGGAVDFLTKPFDQREFLDAIGRAVAKDERDHKIQNERKSVENRLHLLTRRERQVLGYVVQGRLNKQIGAALHISEKTVKVHRSRVMEKMRAGSAVELVRLMEKIYETHSEIQNPND
jgi:FixJ family two-component response regulator